MEKLIYLLRKAPDQPIAAFRDALLASGGPVAGAEPVRALTVEVADLADTFAGTSHVMGQGASLAGVVSVWVDSLDRRGAIEAWLREHAETGHGYLVTESVPQPCADRDWPAGTRSPGVTHFTWFPKPERLTDGL